MVGDGGVLTDLDMYYIPILDSEKIFLYFYDPIVPNNRGIRNDFFATPSRNSLSALVGFTTIRTLGFGGICNIGVLT